MERTATRTLPLAVLLVGCVAEPPAEVRYGRIGEDGYGLSDEQPVIFAALPIDPADPDLVYSTEITAEVLEEGVPFVPPGQPAGEQFALQVQLVLGRQADLGARLIQPGQQPAEVQILVVGRGLRHEEEVVLSRIWVQEPPHPVERQRAGQ